MEENNRKGNTFYAVIGVATLVVAIIGATFAFFSASKTNDTDITGNTAEAGGLTVTANRITTGTNSNIIPLNLITNQTLKKDSRTEYVDSVDQFEKAMTGKCKDSLGNNVCDIYEVVVSNLSKTSTVNVQGKLTLSGEGTNTTNMYWTLINADVEKQTTETETTYTFNGATAIADFAMVPQAKTGFLTYSAEKEAEGSENAGLNKAQSLTLYGTDNSASGASSKTFYVLVWLEETGAEQQDDDASTTELRREYKGTITFDAVDANGTKSGVTATFS